MSAASELDEGDGEDPASEPSAALLSQAISHGAAAAVASKHGTAVREILALAWPVMLSQCVVMAVGAIDVALVGRISAQHVAAVGFATQFYNLSHAMLFAVALAGLALVARAAGAGDHDRARNALAAALQISTGLAALLIAAIVCFDAPLLRALGAEPRVLELARPYLVLMMASLAPLSVCVVLEHGLRAEKNPRAALWIAASVAVAKLGLSFVLVFGWFGLPRLELVGAGLATLTAQLLGLAGFAWRVSRAGPDSALRLRTRDLRVDFALLRRILRISIPGIGERLVMNGALLLYFRVLTEYGSLAVAAYTIGIRFLSFSWIPGTGFASAAATLVGQALGACWDASAVSAGWRSMWLALATALAMATLCIGASDTLAALLAREPALVAELATFIVALGFMQPFVQAHFALGGAHRGAGDAWTPLIASTVGTCAVRAPLAAGAALGFGSDIRWLWGALVLDHAIRFVWLAISFRRGRWSRVRI